MTWGQIFTVDRNLNIFLAIIATWCLVYRIVAIIHKGNRQWMWMLTSYVFASGVASAQYAVFSSPSGPVSLIFTGLHCLVIWMSLKRSRRKGEGVKVFTYGFPENHN